MLDNIEIMRTSARAREIVEALRDPVLSIPGLRWVLCGALGIVYGIARSPRLQGILTHPVEVGPIEDQEPGRILQSRIETFALAPEDVFMPVSEKSFSFVFDLLRGHIRNVLSEMNSFCHWIADHGWQQKILQNSTWSRVLFDKWIKEKSLKALADSQEYVRPASWRRLDEIARAGGIVSMRDLLGLSPGPRLGAEGELRDQRAALGDGRRQVALTQRIVDVEAAAPPRCGRRGPPGRRGGPPRRCRGEAAVVAVR